MARAACPDRAVRTRRRDGRRPAMRWPHWSTGFRGEGDSRCRRERERCSTATKPRPMTSRERRLRVPHAGMFTRCRRRGARVLGVRNSERAHALLPQFAREGEQDRSDNQPDEAEHLEAAEAAHQDPDEGQVSPVARDHGAHDLVAAEQDETAQRQREKRRRGGARHGELQRQCSDGRIAEERNERERSGDRGPQGGVRDAGEGVRDPACEPVEQPYDQHAVHRGAQGPRGHVDIAFGALADAVAKHPPDRLRQRFALLVQEEQHQDREQDDEQVPRAGSGRATALRSAAQPGRCAASMSKGRRVAQARSPSSQPARARRAGTSCSQRGTAMPSWSAAAMLEEQCVGLREQRTEREHQRREHEHGHRGT